jgi:hypothetical protein
MARLRRHQWPEKERVLATEELLSFPLHLFVRQALVTRHIPLTPSFSRHSLALTVAEGPLVTRYCLYPFEPSTLNFAPSFLLTPLFPLDSAHFSVTPLFPLDTRIGGGGYPLLCRIKSFQCTLIPRSARRISLRPQRNAADRLGRRSLLGQGKITRLPDQRSLARSIWGSQTSVDLRVSSQVASRPV